MKQRSFRRLTMSAKAPAGRVKRKNGREATVEIRDSKNVEEPSMFIVQVAAVSCAATHVAESKMANQSFRYTGFCNAAKVEVPLRRTFINVVEAVGAVTRKLEIHFIQVAKSGSPAEPYRDGVKV
jgi:hypothetical protein